MIKIETEKSIANANKAGIFIVVTLLILSCLYLILVTEPQFDCTQRQIAEIEAKALTCNEKDVETCYNKLIQMTCPLRRVK